MGVLLGFLTASLVCLANVTMLVTAAATSGFHGGIAHLAQGSASYVTRWSTAFHIFINVLSTLLLCASNYTMQVLSSPSREQVDITHARGEFLDVGILSTRNLHYFPRKRVILWLALAISSVPLHIL
jgi:hypothetical protein